MLSSEAAECYRNFKPRLRCKVCRLCKTYLVGGVQLLEFHVGPGRLRVLDLPGMP